MRKIPWAHLFACALIATFSAGCCAGIGLADLPAAKAREAPRVRFETAIDTGSVDTLINDLNEALKAKPKRLWLVLVTPGGYNADALRLIKAMEEIQRTTPIYCEVDGDTSSAGVAVLQTCARRIMTQRSRLMVHEPYFPTLINVTLDDLSAKTSQLAALRTVYIAQCVARMNISAAEFAAHIRGREWYLDAPTALKLGAIDEIKSLVVNDK